MDTLAVQLVTGEAFDALNLLYRIERRLLESDDSRPGFRDMNTWSALGLIDQVTASLRKDIRSVLGRD